MDYQENEMRKLLNNMPKIKASDTFEEKLYARIENNDFYEEKESKMWVAVASSAAGLAIAFYSFGFFSTPVSENTLDLKRSQVAETKVIEPKQDSLKQAPKPFDQKVIIVNDKK